MQRFVILYRNQQDIRKNVEQTILETLDKGFDFTSQSLRTPFFQTRPSWPTTAEIFKIPMWLQCEEVEVQDKKLVSLRVLVIDVPKAE